MQGPYCSCGAMKQLLLEDIFPFNGISNKSTQNYTRKSCCKVKTWFRKETDGDRQHVHTACSPPGMLRSTSFSTFAPESQLTITGKIKGQHTESPKPNLEPNNLANLKHLFKLLPHANALDVWVYSMEIPKMLVSQVLKIIIIIYTTYNKQVMTRHYRITWWMKYTNLLCCWLQIHTKR